jgi:hypothetical protein
LLALQWLAEVKELKANTPQWGGTLSRQCKWVAVRLKR